MMMRGEWERTLGGRREFDDLVVAVADDNRLVPVVGALGLAPSRAARKAMVA
jgi:hypothetical protein